MALSMDTPLLTAIGNDQDFSFAFVDQFRTDGASRRYGNGIFHERQVPQHNAGIRTRAKWECLPSVARQGRGRLPELCDYCFVVPSFSIPRIQETHETLLHLIWHWSHVIRGEEDVL